MPSVTCCGAGDIHEAKPDYYLHISARILGQAEQMGCETILTICNVCTLNLRQANYDLGRFQFNTVASACMKMLNALKGAARPASDAERSAHAAVTREGLGILLRVLYPACPHATHGLWQELGFEAEMGELIDTAWPAVDEAALVQDQIELVLQVNGKTRGAVKVPAQADKAAIEAAALASEEFAKFAEGKPAKKVIVVPGRLVNVVV